MELIDKMNNPDNHQNFGEMDEDDLEVITDSKSYIEMCVFRRLSKKIKANPVNKLVIRNINTLNFYLYPENIKPLMQFLVHVCLNMFELVANN